MPGKNAFYAQSGGPTAAINAAKRGDAKEAGEEVRRIGVFARRSEFMRAHEPVK